MPRILAILFAVFSLLTASPALGGDVDVSVMNKVLHGQDKPSVTLTFNRAVRDATIELRGIDQKVQRFRCGKNKAGESFTATLRAQPGNYEVRGNLSVVFQDGSVGEMPLHFSLVVAAPMTIAAPYNRIMQQAGQLEIQLNRIANYCDSRVLYEDGTLVEERTTFQAPVAGSWLRVGWSVPQQFASEEHAILKLTITCFDTDYFSNGIELSPWWLEIPHDDVIFASGSWAIDAGEREKIDNVLPEIQDAVRKFGHLIPLALYISGHTDTVGEASANKILADRRAAAIARHLKNLGLTVKLFYRGTGEQELGVPTADNVDDPRNRRARYILSNGAPNAKVWKKL